MSKLLLFALLILECVSSQREAKESASEQNNGLETLSQNSLSIDTVADTKSNLDGEEADPAFYIKVVLNITICLLGTVFNTIVIGLIIALKEYRKAITHWYVLQLAIADLIFLLTIPFKVTQQVYDAWIFPEWFCKAEESILFINYYASVLFLMVMSIDRYFSVCHALSEKFQRLKKLKSAIIISVAVWIVATLFTIPTMIYATKVGREPNCKCTEFYHVEKNYTENCLLTTSLSLSACLIYTAIDERPGNCKISFEERYIEFLKLKSKKTQLDIDERYNFEFTEELINDFESGEILYELYYSSGWNESISDSYATTSDFTATTVVKKNRNSAAPERPPAQCHYFDQPLGWKARIAFNFAVMFLLPVLVMSIFYGLIIQFLASTSNIEGRSSNNKDKKDNVRTRCTIICASLVITFVICWLPYHAVHLAKWHGIYGQTGKTCEEIFLFASVFAFLNSALNPFLYSFILGGFSKRMKEAANKTISSIMSS